MNTTPSICIATAVLACPLLLSTQVFALEIPEPGDAGAQTAGVACSALPKDRTGGPVVYGFMGRAGW